MAIKIIQYTKYCSYSGTDRTAQLFAKYLAQDPNFEVYYLYQEDGPKERLSTLESWIGKDHCVPYRHIHAKNPQPPYFPLQSDFKEVVATIDPDIFHFHNSGYVEWPFCAKDLFPSKTKLVNHNIFGYSTNFPLDKVIYICNWIRERALVAGNQDGSVLYNPIEKPFVDENYFDHLNDKYSTIRSIKYKQYCKNKLNISQDSIILGRFGRNDNFDPISLKAFQRIEKIFDNVYYYIFNPCDGWIKTAKRLKIRNIVWKSPVYNDEELALWHGAMDIYCHARCDGDCHSTAIEQALMYGIPAISHYGATYQGQVEQLMDIGFCVPYQDDKAYFNSLYGLINDLKLREILGLKSQLRSLRLCEANMVVNKLKRIYNEMV